MTTATHTQAISGSKAGTLVAATLIGLVFVYAVGFMPAEAMHAAAHDTRHAVTAPCH